MNVLSGATRPGLPCVAMSDSDAQVNVPAHYCERCRRYVKGRMQTPEQHVEWHAHYDEIQRKIDDLKATLKAQDQQLEGALLEAKPKPAD